MTVHACGCQNAPHFPSGVLHSVSKCPGHRRAYRDPATLGEAYYAELGLLKGGKLAETAHVAELAEALGVFPSASQGALALEIGCGASPYVRAITGAGYAYLGIEPSHWAAWWVRETYGVDVRCATVEDSFLPLPLHSLILAAHVLEHLGDAPAAILSLAAMLKPGGELWVIVPDDSDPVNPDHLWFFTPGTLRSCLESAGLVVERTAVRRHVPHENFLYARARKPG